MSQLWTPGPALSTNETMNYRPCLHADATESFAAAAPLHASYVDFRWATTSTNTSDGCLTAWIPPAADCDATRVKRVLEGTALLDFVDDAHGPLCVSLRGAS